MGSSTATTTGSGLGLAVRLGGLVLPVIYQRVTVSQEQTLTPSNLAQLALPQSQSANLALTVGGPSPNSDPLV